MDSQLKRGVLEICVLRAISFGDTYGYQIIKQLESNIKISESTLYPILKRLEASNYLLSYNLEHNNRIRKLFTLTDEGRNKIENFKKEFENVIRIYEYIKI